MNRMPKLTPRSEWILLLLITLLGAVLRLYRLQTLPPGDGFDVAQYGVDALEILAGARPVFLPTNFGREVLFSYLVALVYGVTGPGTFGIHLASALVGIATIPAVWWAARELLADEQGVPGRYGPLLAAFVTAVSYWHLNWSRVGLRVIWVPLFAALITAVLWRAFRLRKAWLFALAGALLGLSLYTYQAARLLPLLVVVAFAMTAVARRRFGRHEMLQLAITAVAALVVFAPLGFYAMQYPAVFNDRVRQAVVIAEDQSPVDQLLTLVDQSWAALRMFVLEGDNEPQFTLPRRPSLNPFLAAAFLLGLAIAAWRWRRPRMLYLLAWLALLTAPAMVASQAATAKRALGAFPAVALLIAIGLLVPYAWLRMRGVGTRDGLSGRRSLLSGLVLLLIAAGLLWTTAVTYRDYFLVWGQDLSLIGHFQVDHTQVGAAAGQVPRDENVLVSPFDVTHPAVQLHAGPHPNLRRYDGHFCMLYPDTAVATTYVIVPGPQEQSVATLTAVYPGLSVVNGPARPDTGAPFFQTVRVLAGSTPRLTPAVTLDATWNGAIRLVGVDVSAARVAPGETFDVTLTYAVERAVAADYTAFVQLLGLPRADGNPIFAQSDSEPCRTAVQTSSLRPGDRLVDTVMLTVAEDAAPGSYTLVTGFYTWPDIERVPVTQPNPAQHVVLQQVEVVAP